jgi:hypothetical protein
MSLVHWAMVFVLLFFWREIVRAVARCLTRGTQQAPTKEGDVNSSV